MDISVEAWNELWHDVHTRTSDAQHDVAAEAACSLLVAHDLLVGEDDADPVLALQAGIEIGFLLALSRTV